MYSTSCCLILAEIEANRIWKEPNICGKSTISTGLATSAGLKGIILKNEPDFICLTCQS